MEYDFQEIRFTSPQRREGLTCSFGKAHEHNPGSRRGGLDVAFTREEKKRIFIKETVLSRRGSLKENRGIT